MTALGQSCCDVFPEVSSYVSHEQIQVPVVRNGPISSLVHHEGEVCPAEQLGFYFARTQSFLCQFGTKGLPSDKPSAIKSLQMRWEETAVHFSHKLGMEEVCSKFQTQEKIRRVLCSKSHVQMIKRFFIFLFLFVLLLVSSQKVS